MSNSQHHIRLDEENFIFVKNFKKINKIATINDTINLIIKNYSMNITTLNQLSSIHHDLYLQRKYLNELRKNEFIILNLLNAITYDNNLDLPVNHNSKDLQSIAFQNALINYQEYISEIKTKIAENNKKIDGLGDFTDE